MINLAKFNLLEKSCLSCTKCSLSKERINVVFGRGNPKAKILIIGEGPGQQEDEQGLAFVGRAGKMLDKSFLSVGIDTNMDCYISNIVKCRPPKNRKPKNIADFHHNPLHAKVLKQRADSLNIKNVVYAPGIGIIDKSRQGVVEFIIENLN